MDEEQPYIDNSEYLAPEMNQYFADEISNCVIVRDTGSNLEECDDKYISVSMIVGLMEIVNAKLCSELSDIIAAMESNRVHKRNALFMKADVDTEGLTQPNVDLSERIDNINNPEIYELISKDVDPMKLTKYFTSVMAKFIAEEIRKCLLVWKTESNNRKNEKYIPVSTLERMMKKVSDKFSSDMLVRLATTIRNQEAEFNELFAQLEVRKENDHRIIKLGNDMIKRLDNMKKEAIIKQDNDMLKQLNNIEIPLIPEISNMHIHTKDDRGQEELHFKDEKKKTSIICRYANSNKKLQIISARKQLKGKRGDPLPGAAI